MGSVFNLEEVFDIAINIEKNGAQFYKLAAEKFDDSKSKDVFMGLAKMEENHIRIFSELKKVFFADSQYFNDSFDDAGLYLKEFTSGCVFDLSIDFDSFFSDVVSVRDILKKAIGFEKDSIVFFTGIQKLVPDNLGKDKISEIIDQEMDHVGQLGRQIAMEDA